MEKRKKAHIQGNESLPAVGDTVLRALVIDGDVVVVDQNGLMVNGFVSASIESGCGIVSNITLTVRSHRD